MNNQFIHVLINLSNLQCNYVLLKSRQLGLSKFDIFAKTKSPFLGAYELVLVNMCFFKLPSIRTNYSSETLHLFRCALNQPNLVLYTIHNRCYVLNFTKIQTSLMTMINSKLYPFYSSHRNSLTCKLWELFRSYQTIILFIQPPPPSMEKQMKYPNKVFHPKTMSYLFRPPFHLHNFIHDKLFNQHYPLIIIPFI